MSIKALIPENAEFLSLTSASDQSKAIQDWGQENLDLLSNLSGLEKGFVGYGQRWAWEKTQSDLFYYTKRTLLFSMLAIACVSLLAT